MTLPCFNSCPGADMVSECKFFTVKGPGIALEKVRQRSCSKMVGNDHETL